MATDVSNDLKKLSKSWAKTEAKKGGRENFPDGEYTLALQSMEVSHSKKGRIQVVSAFKIQKPKDMKGKDKLVFHGIENENNIAYFKGYAEVIGLELPDDMEDLPDALQSFVDDNEDELRVKFSTNKGGYQNMTILAVGDQEIELGKDKDSDSDDEDESEDSENEENDEDEESEDEDSEDESEDEENEDEDEGDEEEDEDDEDDDKKDKKKKKAKKGKKDKKKKKKSRK